MRIYQVDSFTDQLFSGNPAGVCLLAEEWLPEDLMQKIAMEMNLSETTFVRRGEDGSMEIRWFTPMAEVDLCGHATLAAAHVLFRHEKFPNKELTFQSRKGFLKVTDEGKLLTLDFPRDYVYPIEFTEDLDCFNQKPREAWRGTGEYLLVFDRQEQVEDAVCNLNKAAGIDLDGFIITAPSNIEGVDFVSRYFSPKYGIDEDPVTGSAHTLLVPYWQGVTGQDTFHARQLSIRGGNLTCRAVGDRILISGQAVTFFVGEMIL